MQTPVWNAEARREAGERSHERMLAVLARLGNPQLAVPAVHVGGTNGKGSVCALLTAVLSSAGYRVGRFTSPHLESWTERIWLSGEPIAPRSFEALCAEVAAAEQAVLGACQLGEFQRVTAAAFLYFQRNPPDVTILEVGRGGRYDATNALTSPLLTVVTNVTLDHTDVLGPTEADIAREKAGILKRGCTALTQAVGDAYHVLSRTAREVGARLVHVPVASYVSPAPCGQRIGYRGNQWDLGLLGTYQLQNAALALEAVDRLRSDGLEVPEEALRQALREARWPGRMEFVRTGSESWLLDGAHNLAGAVELAASLKRHFGGQEIVVVMGVMADKAGPKMLEVLAPFAQTTILTSPPSSRALPPDRLADGQAHSDLRVVKEPQSALETARRLARGRLIVVCGSLYLIGLTRAFLRETR